MWRCYSLSLFGVLNAPYQTAQRRLDCLGLIPSLAWSKIKGNLSGLETGLVGLDSKQAYIEMKGRNDKSGSILIKPRILPSANISIPFWENQHLTGVE